MKQLNTIFLLLLVSLVGFAQDVRVLDASMPLVIERLDQLNSTFQETNLSVTPSGNTLFYMSDRGGQPWSRMWDQNSQRTRYDGDLWFSQKVNGRWQKPECLSGAVNTSQGEDEPNIAPDGRRVVYQSWNDNWAVNGGPYYLSLMNGPNWSQPRGLGGGISRFFVQEFLRHSGYGTDGAALSPDGTRFVFACGADYFGNMDLYMSVMTPYGEWSFPQRLELSTPLNERSVFFGADSRTLYFSSNGYGGFGGLDIFKTTLNPDGSHGEIVNLGKRFNTREDDYGFIIAASGKEAFFVREGDIFHATFDAAPDALRPQATALISGRVRQLKGGPVSRKIRLLDAETGEEQLVTYSDAEDGSYSLFVNNPDRPFQVQVIQDELVAQEEEVRFKAGAAYSEESIDFTLPDGEEEIQDRWIAAMGAEEAIGRKDIPVVKRKVFQHIYFRFGVENLSIKEQFRLNGIIQYLQKNPQKTIQVTGYSDMRGSRSFKEKLARDRAEAVCAYLINNGIAAQRIQADYFPNAHHYAPQSSTPHQGIRKVEISFPEQNEGTRLGLSLDLSQVAMNNRPPTTREEELGWAELLIDLQKQMDAQPDNPSPYLERALVRVMKGELKDALADFDEALKRKGYLPEVCLYRASVKEQLEDYQGALFDYNNILEREPKNAMAWFNRGNLKMRMGNRLGACRDWSKANTYAPGIATRQLRDNNCN